MNTKSRKLAALIAYLIFAIFMSIPLFAAELFVAPNGSDSNTGSREKPFATLQKARDTIRAKKTHHENESWFVHIAPGVYKWDRPVEFTAQDSGSAENPVVYRGAGSGGKTVFSAGKKIEGWTTLTEGPWKGAWVAQIPKTNGKPDYFEQLFVNGNRAVRARYPNFNNGKPEFLNPQAISQEVPMVRERMNEPFTAQTLTAKPGELRSYFQDVPQEELKYAQLVVHHHWDTSRRIPLRFDAETETIHVQGHPMKSWNPWRTTSQYYIENLRTAFDMPGEWFYEGTTGKVYY